MNESAEMIVARLTAWLAEHAPDYLESVGVAGGFDTVAEAIIGYAVDQNAEVTRQSQLNDELRAARQTAEVS